MTSLVPIVLFGWIVAVQALFLVLSPRRAVLVSFLFAWLFLPQAAIEIAGLPDITKISVTSFSVLLAIICFDAQRVMRFRPSWIDLPIVAWCLAPLASSLANGLGAYDGGSGVLSELFLWGIPFFVGRLYFNDKDSIRDLAVAIFIGGLVYVPLCLIEIRLSPQLHHWVYGYHQHSFLQTMRFGGYRPMVFMQHGLMVGMWMTSASLIGVWLWKTGAMRRLCGMPVLLFLPVLLGTTILCKSTGALILLVAGLGFLFVNRWTKSAALVLLIVAIPPLYVTARAKNLWSGEQLVTAATMIDAERAESLQGRFDNELLLVEKAAEKPWFGWGRWGRWRIYNDRGEDITVSDSLWVISLGEKGLVGIAALMSMLLLPIMLMVRRVPVRYWHQKKAAPIACLAVILVLFAIDNLINAMLNPVFVLAMGGLSGLYLSAKNWSAESKRARRIVIVQSSPSQTRPAVSGA